MLDEPHPIGRDDDVGAKTRTANPATDELHDPAKGRRRHQVDAALVMVRSRRLGPEPDGPIERAAQLS